AASRRRARDSPGRGSARRSVGTMFTSCARCQDYGSIYETSSLKSLLLHRKERCMTSLDTLRPDQATDSTGIGGPSRRRTWTLVVTCAGVALVVASMVALNTALGDIAVATSATQTQLTWVVDGYT